MGRECEAQAGALREWPCSDQKCEGERMVGGGAAKAGEGRSWQSIQWSLSGGSGQEGGADRFVMLTLGAWACLVRGRDRHIGMCHMPARLAVCPSAPGVSRQTCSRPWQWSVRGQSVGGVGRIVCFRCSASGFGDKPWTQCSAGPEEREGDCALAWWPNPPPGAKVPGPAKI